MNFHKLFLCLTAIVLAPSYQSEGVNITDLAKWEESPDLKIIEGEVRFRSQTSLDDVTLLPKIIIDVTFQNTGGKAMSSMEFNFLFYSRGRGEADEKEIQFPKAKPLFYKTLVF